MDNRMRSPNYPSMPIGQAIDLAGRMFNVERTNSVDRAVAAVAMGFSGLTGRSAKVLADLIQYGLVEKAGKSEVRVSPLAVDILHPDDSQQKAQALQTASKNPELFRRISERFPFGRPSEAALKSFLLKEGFTDAALAPVRRAYFETVDFMAQEVGSERNGIAAAGEAESQSEQEVEQELPMNASPIRSPSRADAPAPTARTQPAPPAETGKPSFWWKDQKIGLGGGVISTVEEADEVIQFITALKGLLRPAPVATPPVSAPAQSEEPGLSDLEG